MSTAGTPKIIPFDIADFAKDWSEEKRRAYADKSSTVRLGVLMRRFREAAGLSQTQLAELVGSSQPHISDIERGAGHQGPTVAFLARIATACNVEFTIAGEPIAGVTVPARAEVAAAPQSQTHPHTEIEAILSEARQKQRAGAAAPRKVSRPVQENEG